MLLYCDSHSYPSISYRLVSCKLHTKWTQLRLVYDRFSAVTVPCAEDFQCILYGPQAECGGVKLAHMPFETVSNNGTLLLSESDCLCYMYADSAADAADCISYSKWEGMELPFIPTIPSHSITGTSLSQYFQSPLSSV